MIKPSEPDKVTAYIQSCEHPQKDVLIALREVILAADPEVGEEVKWNAPAFFFTGEMPPFDPKEYRRHLVVSNLHPKDCIRLVLMGAGKVDDPSGLLTGDYKDGRRLAAFRSVEDVAEKRDALQHIVREQIRLIER